TRPCAPGVLDDVQIVQAAQIDDDAVGPAMAAMATTAHRDFDAGDAGEEEDSRDVVLLRHPDLLHRMATALGRQDCPQGIVAVVLRADDATPEARSQPRDPVVEVATGSIDLIQVEAAKAFYLGIFW